MTTPLIPLESIQIATSCRANWNAMAGDEQVRFCQSCQKNVYNLSAMTREEAMLLLREKEGACVRLYRRKDGTVITSDCTVGQQESKRSRKTQLFLIALGFLAALFGLSGVDHRQPRVFMGDYMPTTPTSEITPQETSVSPAGLITVVPTLTTNE